MFKKALCILLLVFTCLPAYAEVVPLPGTYELQNGDGELKLTRNPNYLYKMEIFTSTDNDAHFCDFSGTFVQEVQVLVQHVKGSDKLPLVLFIIDENTLEIREDGQAGEDACGLGQTMKGTYVRKK